jgi:hypothetical protein
VWVLFLANGITNKTNKNLNDEAIKKITNITNAITRTLPGNMEKTKDNNDTETRKIEKRNEKLPTNQFIIIGQ